MTKLEALAKFLGCEIDEVSESRYDDSVFEVDREEYRVYTDNEADIAAKEYILDSVWAFNASFLAAHSDLDTEVIESIQANGKYEDNNKVLLKLIDDTDHFVDDAVSADGRGHFLAGYDSEESVIHFRDNTGTGHTLYIYRTN